MSFETYVRISICHNNAAKKTICQTAARMMHKPLLHLTQPTLRYIAMNLQETISTTACFLSLFFPLIRITTSTKEKDMP